MPRLIINKSQIGHGRTVKCYPTGSSVTDIMLSEYPDGINPTETRIYLNQTELNPNSNNELLFKPLTNESVTVVEEAKGLDPITIAIIVAISIATSLLLQPEIPGNAGNTKQSPNNQHQGQSNIARPYEAIPLIFGSPIAYPDLIGEPIIEYVNHIKLIRQYLCVGLGLFDIDQIRIGATPIENFSDATTTTHEPVSKVTTIDDYVTSFQINEIDNNELLGKNEGFDGTDYDLVENGTNNTVYQGTTFVFEVVKDTESDALKTDFDADPLLYSAKLDYSYEPDDFSGIETASGTGQITSIVLDGGSTFYTITIIGFNGPESNASTPFYEDPFKITKRLDAELGPFNIQVQTDEVWTNFIFPRGLKGSVDITATYTQLDGPNGSPIVGPPEGASINYTDDTLEQRFFTHKKTLSTKNWFQVSYLRTNNSNADAAKPDQCTVEAAFAINTDTTRDFPNATIIDSVIPASSGGGTQREDKINVELTSKLISYDGAAVNLTPTASRRFADAILHLYVDYYGFDSATLELDELYAIQDAIDAVNPELGVFDFTFDDLDVSLDERMDAILNVARCFKWLDGDVYRFKRDEKRLFPSTVINRRDIAQDSSREYSIKYNPQLLQSYDSVKVEYIDQATNKKNYIFRKTDGAGNIIDGVGVKPLVIELAGCKEVNNAINRAELEIRKLIYQRWTLNDTLLPSGMLIDRGDMVLYSEQYNNTNNIFDGEILSVVGNVATCSEEITFDGTSQYQVHYTIEDGSVLGPFDVTEVAGKPKKFGCASLSQVFVRDSELGFLIQTGSRYIISVLETVKESQWLLSEKEASGRNVQVAMINYDDRIYEFDGV